MKKLYNSIRGVIVLALLTGSSSVLAQTIHPNGFPSGPHYNLNIHGKKLDYNCTPVVYNDLGQPVYGNSIFVPETGEDIQILIKSGRKGGRASTSYPEFRVTDACAAFDNSPAVLELPPSETGYWVYARALAKPGGSATLSYGGSLFSAIDEYGNDLVYLGLVTSGGVALPGKNLERNKGKSTAVDITGMFMWTGTLCNIAFEGTPTGTQRLCWIDADASGAVSSGDFFSPSDPLALLGAACSTTLCVNSSDGSISRPDALGNCSVGTVPTVFQGIVTDVPVTCIDYSLDPTWIFNIAELVESDWLIDNEGSKLIQLRFYPAGSTVMGTTSFTD